MDRSPATWLWVKFAELAEALQMFSCLPMLHSRAGQTWHPEALLGAPVGGEAPHPMVIIGGGSQYVGGGSPIFPHPMIHGHVNISTKTLRLIW